MLQSNIDENNKQLLDEAEFVLCTILQITQEPYPMIVLLFIQTISQFKNKLKHAHIPLSMLSSLLHLPVPRQIQDIQGCLI